MTTVGTKRRGILAEIAAERVRQDEKWGELRDYPDGTNPTWASFAGMARDECDAATEVDELTWLDIVKEEIFESFAETLWPKLRAELVQAAAAIVAWIEAGDRRDGGV